MANITDKDLKNKENRYFIENSISFTDVIFSHKSIDIGYVFITKNHNTKSVRTLESVFKIEQ